MATSEHTLPEKTCICKDELQNIGHEPVDFCSLAHGMSEVIQAISENTFRQRAVFFPLNGKLVIKPRFVS